MSKKTLQRVLLAVFTALALAGCEGKKTAGTGTGDGRDAEGLFHLRAVSPTGSSETPVGYVLGFFREEGIEIDFIGTTQAGVTDFQLLDTNQIDFAASGHPAELARAILAGTKIKAIAGGMVDHPDFPHIRYITQEDSSIYSLNDLVGKKVGVGNITTCTSGYVQYYLKSQGIDPETVEFVVISGAGLVEQAVPLGAVDLATGHPPHAERVYAGGGVRQVARSWDIFHSPGAGLSIRSVRDDLIEEHPEVVQGLVNALYKTRIWMNTHPEDTKRVMAEWLGIEKENLSVFWFDPNKNIEPSYIEQWFEISETLGLWEIGEIQPEDIYTNQFVPRDIDEDWANL